jgi:hypothetical protein
MPSNAKKMNKKPSMVMHTIRYHARELHEAYPRFFNLQYMDEILDQDRLTSDHPQLLLPGPPVGRLSFWNGMKGGPSVARNAMIVYFAWWIPYTIWMLTIGLKLPVQRKDKVPKYDTVFHSLWRGGPNELVGSLLWKRPKAVSLDQSKRNDFEVRDLMVYMVGHAIACLTIGIGLVSGICYLGGKHAHYIMIVLATTICAERGAQRYTYYTTVSSLVFHGRFLVCSAYIPPFTITKMLIPKERRSHSLTITDSLHHSGHVRAEIKKSVSRTGKKTTSGRTQ